MGVDVAGASPPHPARESDKRETKDMPNKNLFNLCSLVAICDEPHTVYGNRYKSNTRKAECPGKGGGWGIGVWVDAQYVPCQ
jgi:hypothetical protein